MTKMFHFSEKQKKAKQNGNFFRFENMKNWKRQNILFFLLHHHSRPKTAFKALEAFLVLLQYLNDSSSHFLRIILQMWQLKKLFSLPFSSYVIVFVTFVYFVLLYFLIVGQMCQFYFVLLGILYLWVRSYSLYLIIWVISDLLESKSNFN